jgi:hypothetical protein
MTADQSNPPEATAERSTDRTDTSNAGLSTADIAGTERTTPSAPSRDVPTSGDGAAETQPMPASAAASASTAAPASGAVTATDAGPVDGDRAPLFDQSATADLRGRWDTIQAGFVDEPRQSVEQADALVAEVMKRLAESFANERQDLERQWSQGDDVSTEDLRLSLRRYRSFFDRLLSL